jgi:peptidoglycan/LPS O-acetylase OafA/YrhL
MQPALTTRQHYPALDGLRGLAILLVVFYHNFGFINYFFFGWLGVDLFFVLSGYLITSILMNDLGNKNYLRNFYMRRMLRIFPLYYLCLIIFLLIVPAFNINLDVKYYTDNQVWLWTYFQNWLYILKPNEVTNTLHHFWSLAVEEQFYLIWPVTILIVKKPKRLIVLLCTVLIAVIVLRYIVWIYKIENLAYFNLFTFSRVDGICIGSILALLMKTNPRFIEKYTTAIILSLAGVNFLFYFFNRDNNFTFPYLAIAGYTTFAVMLALLVYESIKGANKPVELLFNNRIMKFFGKYSYGLYVYHWPVYLLLNDFLVSRIMDNISFIPPRIIASLISTSAAIVLSVISYRYFENYFIKRKKAFK